jgi:hypothetical protein
MSGPALPSIKQLKINWEASIEALSLYFASLSEQKREGEINFEPGQYFTTAWNCYRLFFKAYRAQDQKQYGPCTWHDGRDTFFLRTNGQGLLALSFRRSRNTIDNHIKTLTQAGILRPIRSQSQQIRRSDYQLNLVLNPDYIVFMDSS